MKGSRAEGQWRAPVDFAEAAAGDATRQPTAVDIYFVVKLGGKEARSSSAPLHPLRHLNLKLIEKLDAIEVTVTHSGGRQKVRASERLDAELRTTGSSCFIDFGRGPVEVTFDVPPPSDARGARLRLASLGYHTGTEDNPYDPQLVQAIARFQADEGRTVSGKLDADTQAALKQKFGL